MRPRISQIVSVVVHVAVVFALIHFSAVQQMPVNKVKQQLSWVVTKLEWHIPPGDFRGILGLDLPGLGIPEETRYVEMYCKRTGRAGIERSQWDFYMAYNLFRIAAILQGIAKRVLDGTAASEHAREAGSRAPLMAELGWKQVEKILKRSH